MASNSNLAPPRLSLSLQPTFVHQQQASNSDASATGSRQSASPTLYAHHSNDNNNNDGIADASANERTSLSQRQQHSLHHHHGYPQSASSTATFTYAPRLTSPGNPPEEYQTRSSPSRRASLAPTWTQHQEANESASRPIEQLDEMQTANASSFARSGFHRPNPYRSSMVAAISSPDMNGMHAVSDSISSEPISPSDRGTSHLLPGIDPIRRPFSMLPRSATSASSQATRQELPLIDTSYRRPDARDASSSTTPSFFAQRSSQNETFGVSNAETPSPWHREQRDLPANGFTSSPFTPSSSKGKQRAEVPIVELRVLPVTDAVNMFGSTQTSSNYSLSGKVVVRVHNVIRDIPSSAHGLSALNLSPSNNAGRQQGRSGLLDAAWLPEIERDSIFLDPEEIFASHKSILESESMPTLHVQEIKLTSLSCTLSGFALYTDHSGRFNACRLTEVTERLLPNGHTLKIPPLGKAQEYEIEFNLSVPGWLPGTNLTRFGGVFYSLEAKANYTAFDSEQQHAIPSSLVPPRRASIMPDSPADIEAEQAPIPVHWQRRNPASDDEEVGRARSAARQAAKGRSESAVASPTTPSTPKSTWLGKRAKQLSMKTKSSSTSASTAAASSSKADRQASLPADVNSIAAHRRSPRLYASKDHISAFSDPIVIVVRRCREVVPVPVARMAIVGPNGAADGTAIDPPMPLTVPLSTGETPAREEGRQRSSSPPIPAGPPVAPTTFDVPSDPAKAAAHASSHAAATSESGNARRRANASGETSHSRASRSGSNIPMRHFLHRPMLHPPADANIPHADKGLPFSLTLSLPSYVAIDGPNSDILNFGVQIEVGRSSTWAKVRELGGLRLREMELSCIQTERHCSVPSRTFCHAYPMPTEPQARPFDLPIFGPPPTKAPDGRPLTSGEARLRRGYDRGPVQHHIDLLRAGSAPDPSANNVERVRTVIVGPPPTPAKKSKSDDTNTRGKERDRPKNGHLHSSHGSTAAPAQAEQSGDEPRSSGAHPERRDEPSIEESSNDAGARRNAGRGRRAYQSAMRGLSHFATAVMDISFDTEGINAFGGMPEANASEGRSANIAEGRSKKDDANDSTRAALYSFAGSDGHGVDLTRGRVRMAIKLPLVTSSASGAKSSGTPQLLPDFESPFTKTRHKLQVKLGFGFGSEPLGGEGEWGQSLVMCVPVRFTESAPREVREQFAPMPVQQIQMDMQAGRANALSENTPEGVLSPDSDPSLAASNFLADQAQRRPIGTETYGNGNTHAAAPILPSYNQLFREDGSRLADEGEDLPQYPGPRILPSTAGSVTAPSPGTNGLADDSNDSDASQVGSGSAAQRTNDEENRDDVLSGSTLPNTPGSVRMSERSSSLQGLDTAQPAPATTATFDNRIAPSRVLDESIPLDLRGKKEARALQRMEMEEMHRDERQDEARRIRRLSSHMSGGVRRNGQREDGLLVPQLRQGSGDAQLSDGDQMFGADVISSDDAADDVAGEGDNGPRGSRSHLVGETVMMDDADGFDDEFPAFAAPTRQTMEQDRRDQERLPTVILDPVQ